MKRLPVILLSAVLVLMLADWGWSDVTVATDNFNRATLGTNWTTMTGDGAMDISDSINAIGTGAGACGAYWNANSFNNDQYSIVQYIGDSNSIAPAVRVNGENKYIVTVESTTSMKFYKVTAGPSYTQLGDTLTISAISSGDYIKLSATGSSTVTLTVYVNGTPVGTTTDSSSPIASGSAGMWTYGTKKLDNWEGGNVSPTLNITSASLTLGPMTMRGNLWDKWPPSGGGLGLGLNPTGNNFPRRK